MCDYIAFNHGVYLMTINEWISKAENSIMYAKHFIETSDKKGEVYMVKLELAKLEESLAMLRAEKAKTDIQKNYGMRLQ